MLGDKSIKTWLFNVASKPRFVENKITAIYVFLLKRKIQLNSYKRGHKQQFIFNDGK